MGFSIGSAGAGMGPRGALDSFSEKVEGQAFNPHIIRRLLIFIRPYRLQMGAAFLLMLLSSGLALVIPYLVKIAIDQPIAQGNLDGLTTITLWMLAAFAALYFASAGQRYLLSW